MSGHDPTAGCHCATCRNIGHDRYVDEVADGLLKLVTRLRDHQTGAAPLYKPVRPHEVAR